VGVRCVKITSFTSYHPLVSYNGRIQVLELVTEFLDLLLGNLQTGAHFHSHVLLMNHQHLGDICLDPKSL
jgi:hypothetical protein